MAFRGYIRLLTLTMAGLVLLVAAFNVFIDPYAIFGTPRVEGLNARKPYAGDRARVGKKYQVLARPANGLIIGNSRPELGLDPGNACWPRAAQPVFNLAIPGLSPYNQVRYAQHAIAAHVPRELLVTIDFMDYLTPAEALRRENSWPRPELEPLPLLAAPDNSRRKRFVLDRIEDYVSASLSLTSFVESLATVQMQHGAYTPSVSEQGMNDGAAIYVPIVRHEGTGVLFAQKDRELMEMLSRKGLSLFAEGTHWSPDFEALDHLLALAEEKGITVQLVMNPLHIDYLYAIEINGLWPQFDEWKRRMTRLAADRHAVLWDFNIIDQHSTEPVPAITVRGKALAWFWEPAHYRKELGNLMLDNIFRGSCPAGQTGDDYGVQLTPETIDQHLQMQDELMRDVVASHPDEIARLRALKP